MLKKNLITKCLTKIAFAIILSLTFFACSEESNLTDLKNLKDETMTLDQFFEKVSGMNATNENAIYIDYQWNKKDNTVKLIDFKEREPDFFYH